MYVLINRLTLFIYLSIYTLVGDFSECKKLYISLFSV
jgi:hypothetical protein